MTTTLKDRLKLAMDGPPRVRVGELARACGVKSPSVSGWLSGGTKTIEGANLLNAARKLNVAPEWLATGRGPMKPNDSGTRAPVDSFLTQSESASQPLQIDPDMLREAYLLAVQQAEIETGVPYRLEDDPQRTVLAYSFLATGAGGTRSASEVAAWIAAALRRRDQ